MSLNRFDVAGLVLAAAGALAVSACQPDALASDSYRLDVTAEVMGESHVFTVDHGLSRADCTRAAAADPMAQCVLEQERPGPALVGFGCEGATGPLYAATESEFPECASIERRRG